MKTKDLIDALKLADPTGEEHVCVGNVDIHFIQNEPSYYDGPQQIIERDGCEIKSARFQKLGRKVQIHTISILDVLADNHHLPIDYSQLSPLDAQNTMKHHKEYVEFFKNMENEMEYELFHQWALKKAKELTVDLDDFKDITKSFFDKHIDRNAPIPATHLSYNERRVHQWNGDFNVVMENGFLKVKNAK